MTKALTFEQILRLCCKTAGALTASLLVFPERKEEIDALLDRFTAFDVDLKTLKQAKSIIDEAHLRQRELKQEQQERYHQLEERYYRLMEQKADRDHQFAADYHKLNRDQKKHFDDLLNDLQA